MNLLVLIDQSEFLPHVSYVFRVLSSIYQCKLKVLCHDARTEADLGEAQVVISYGDSMPDIQERPHLHIRKSHLFGEHYLHRASLPRRPLAICEGVPMIYLAEGSEACTEFSGQRAETSIDVVASAFFMLTRYEEQFVTETERDPWGSASPRAQLACKEGCHKRPIVNEYFALVQKWLAQLGVNLNLREHWAPADMALCLTHDVDRIRRFRFLPPVRGMLRAWRRPGGRIQAGRMLQDFVLTRIGLQRDPDRISFERILEIAEQNEMRGTVFILADGSRYSIDALLLAEWVRRAARSGFELGLHGGFSTSTDEEKLRQQKTRLEQALQTGEIVSNRQHYLSARYPETWRNLQAAGIRYDSSAGYRHSVGFRCGICHPFHPFDVQEGRVLDILEIPLIAMDTSMFGHAEFSTSEAMLELENLIEQTRRFHGVLTVLWHHNSLYRDEFPTIADVYERFVGNIRQQASSYTLRELAERWNDADACTW